MSDELRDIGARLREARQQKELSLRELSTAADVSPSLLSQIENGKTNPSVVTLHNIATALELPITYFFPQSGVKIAEPEPNNNGTKVYASQMTASEARADAASQGQANVVRSYHPLTALEDAVLLASERVSIELMGGVIWERLTATPNKNIEFLEIHYKPQSTSGAVMSRHNGSEFGMVLAGELFLELGFENYTLRKGDCVIFDSMTPHRLTNKQDTEMRAIWVIFNAPQPG